MHRRLVGVRPGLVTPMSEHVDAIDQLYGEIAA
jgi:hypothetical protein